MLVNIATLLAIVAVAIAFAWLTRRAWRSRRAIVKWSGVIISACTCRLKAQPIARALLDG